MFKNLFRITKFIFALYIFILAIELIKKSALFLAGDLSSILLVIKNPLNSLGLGWLATIIMQSSSVFIATIATFVGLNILTLTSGIYLMMGSVLGNSITNLIVSLFTRSKKIRDFRHGFEIALANSLYHFLFIVPFFLIELLFHPFTNLGNNLANSLQGFILLKQVPSIVGFLTNFPVNYFFNLIYSRGILKSMVNH